MKPKQSVEIGLVLYPGAQLAAVLGLTDLFTVANRILVSKQPTSSAALKVTHWQEEVSRRRLVRVFESDTKTSARVSAVILPPSLVNQPDADGEMALIDWLREQHGEGAVLCSVCAGAFLLAGTGLMAGRRMTTHWLHAQSLQQRFPSIIVDSDEMLIDDGDVITAGGLMSWTDLGLRLVDRLLGPAVMLETARTVLVDPPGREQRYYSVFSPRMTHGDAAVLKVQHWLQDTQARDVALASLAAQAGLEERTFLRRFQKATGMTTTEYCQRLRIGRGRVLLESSTLAIDAVAWEVGYQDTAAFRKVFKRILGLSPGDYRQRFSGAAGRAR
ncbi:GlxA family transcriptional regulator [Xanthomonas hortorum]|uniref:HTH-type transcriptional activator RhaR n=1 Tax=Xanthomonas hortorum pv. gardneri TaxID=2754056 RepID=A0A6V7ERN6_9XANT|nr:GlxA family transcriptional regulator [Xanthomonas hortorum]KQQ84151.1 AraC family transcriptional regulator [Xanthomonas sp. Leaf131]MCC4624674.1 GlxA family transcriptional regulator [Xanthomonas campestris pv. nigromaculans]APP79236.1 AraC family transcriptional regulator [Xanthomonas hortorum pv. gardneri]EGD19974.1 transcriptional regulator, AraC family with amidase-like domain [Xanthomonas hortorum ATCC 19865]KLA92883.1 AraC family transcriptional regulator [Xanthomonas hortorum pv. g